MSWQNAADREAMLAQLTESEARHLEYDWRFWARPNQLPPPGEWFVWLLRAGRGFGKTRCGAEFVRAQVESGQWGRVTLIAPTAADARDVMVEGESGILAISPPWFRPLYEPSKRRLTWPNGAIATLFSADEPERLRGPQGDGAWGDEVASWRYLDTAWDNLLFGLRLGRRPRVVLTTTPRPLRWLKRLMTRATTAITSGSSFENWDNLAPSYIDEVIAPYIGTRIGRQEIEGEYLEDIEGALWTPALIDDNRAEAIPADLKRIVVGVDPPGGRAEAGIVAAGIAPSGRDFYVLDDRSRLGSPDTWGRACCELLDWFNGDRIVAEGNYGGSMVLSTIATIDPNAPVKLVHASVGKRIRAEPIAALYEQGRVHHCGTFRALEDELTTYTGDPREASPNRLDALVWALTDLAKPVRRLSAI
jgi:phage terminase large subunit-like protein